MAINPILYKLAKTLSVLGHPLFTVPLVSIPIAFQQLPVKNAVLISGLLVGGIVLPISWHNYQKVKQKRYTNFDVSNQTQRAGFYPVLLGLTALFTLVLFTTGQSKPFSYGSAFVVLLLISSYGINFFLKVSLHTSISFFLACALCSLSLPIGIFMGIFSVLVATSRLLLTRHTLSEVLLGALIGLTTGFGFYAIVVSATTS